MHAAERSLVTVFGSVNLDMIFEVDALPTRGSTLLAHAFTLEPGGKGANQAVAAARDGAAVAMVAMVGTDPLAQPATSGLRANGADLSHVLSCAEPTGCATVLTERGGGNQIVVSMGANGRLESAHLDAALLGRTRMLLLQMESRVEQVERVIARAGAAGVPTILNLAPAVPIATEALRSCALIVVNEDEARVLGGWLACAPDARSLQTALGVDVLKTLGAAGAEVCSSAGGRRTVAAHRIQPVDTTAAGDCFVGVLAAAMAQGVALDAAMERASTAAALSCLRRGSQGSLPSRQEIDAACARAKVSPNALEATGSLTSEPFQSR